MLLLTLLACPPAAEDKADTGDTSAWTPDPASNLCGEVRRPAEADPGGKVWVATVASGEVACVGGDSGGAGWWGETVAEPTLVDERFFEATLEPGEYGVEVVAGMWAGCADVTVTSTDTCAHEALIELGYEVPVDKPNVYLYPEVPTNVHVRIPAWTKITESEPRYPVDGWRVRAFPDGRLATRAGPRDYLFYELTYDVERFQTAEGWCVPGTLAQATIEDAMADLGFLPNEIADFADGWDASFPDAEWMTVYPQVDDLSRLAIDPAPERLLRAWFLVADGCEAVVPPQLEPVERFGYHAAEWGIAFRRPLDRGEIVVEGWR